MKKVVLACCIAAILAGCNSTGKTEPEVKVPNETLIVSSKGKLFNFNLETGKLVWQYVSKEDTLYNQNRFTYDTESVYMPFESGRLVSVQIVSGKVNWNNNYKDDPSEIQAGAVSEDGTIITENSDRYTGPVFMSKPLRYDDKLYIASSGNPQIFTSQFYVINAKDGSIFTANNNSTNYNYYQPVENNKNIYLNSAVYLDLHYKEGTPASNGMYEDAAFSDPLYVQMQASPKHLFLGDEYGKFYALAVEDKGLSKGGDITDPKNNFIDRKDIFEWTYQSKKYPRLGNDQTALADELLIVCKKTEDENKMALIALDTRSGKEKWLYEPQETIKNWQLANQNEITGYTKDEIFVIDLKGKTTFEIPIHESLYPVSNIEVNAKNQLIYITGKGIVSVDRNDKKTKLLIPHTFYPSSSPLNQIKYFKK
ncbi:MAG: PQQ-binding-like beta-propeller repeat protein [Chryseobacterium sp.]|jgi:outer membrane protein assembly factor BamB|uniref:outer membrane protein assembly factor BamB family protein n=1 Tax=Chryseobacterium sp. TaxID=1871047 RepID=UPI00282122D7|nr:PQQ-binding-like beta-propeller repeat protein [Chryseobacterium sp.]MDR2235726.1 PQQ-binding-like beta-propeller repeat protein [Chryseobacterium sp.]